MHHSRPYLESWRDCIYLTVGTYSIYKENYLSEQEVAGEYNQHDAVCRPAAFYCGIKLLSQPGALFQDS
jgi:hypothetical protein